MALCSAQLAVWHHAGPVQDPMLAMLSAGKARSAGKVRSNARGRAVASDPISQRPFSGSSSARQPRLAANSMANATRNTKPPTAVGLAQLQEVAELLSSAAAASEPAPEVAAGTPAARQPASVALPSYPPPPVPVAAGPPPIGGLSRKEANDAWAAFMQAGHGMPDRSTEIGLTAAILEAWEDLLSLCPQARVRLTAAIPMENLCCSCKLTAAMGQGSERAGTVPGGPGDLPAVTELLQREAAAADRR